MTKEEIRATRKKLNLTQKAFGELIGVCADSVRFWEHGRRSPSKSAVKMMERMEVEG